MSANSMRCDWSDLPDIETLRRETQMPEVVPKRDYVAERREAAIAFGVTLHDTNQFIRYALEWAAKKGNIRLECIPEEDGVFSYVVSCDLHKPVNGTLTCVSADENLAMALTGLVHALKSLEE